MDIQKEGIEQFGTPQYLYNLDVFCENIQALKESLLSNRLFFSVKANPRKKFVQVANQCGCGIEVASAGELLFVMKCGVEAKNIIFTGPGKTKEELEIAVEERIYLINVESLQEINMINRMSRDKNCITKIALRINPDIRENSSKVKMSGVSSQFGIEESILSREFFDEIESMKNVEVIGLQLYMGTDILDEKEICDNTAYILELAQNISQKYHLKFSYVNAGGGFGVPYSSKEKPIDMLRLKEDMLEVCAKYSDFLKQVTLCFESGRYLLAECGVFMTRVLYRKESKGNTYLICDGGFNFHASSAFLGRFVRGNFPMYVLEKTGEEKEFFVTGPCCTPTDLLGQRVKLPSNTQEGDVIVIEKSGAYGLTFSPYGFLSHKLPKEVGYGGERGYELWEE